MKKFLNDVLDIFLIICTVIGLFLFTLVMLWPILAIVLIFCVLFWIFVPVIGWIIFGFLILLVILYVLANLMY